MKQITGTMLLIFMWNCCCSQSAEQNMMKYWKHRQRLDLFITKGLNVDPSSRGTYMVSKERITYGNCKTHNRLGADDNIALIGDGYEDNCGGLNVDADQTTLMGWYIGVLATEFALLNNNGLDGSQTLQELWKVIEAFERLDYHAESIYGHSPSLNGWFLRDDVMPHIADPGLFPETATHLEGIGVECIRGSFAFQVTRDDPNVANQNDPLGDPWDVTVTNDEKYRNVPSADQALAILMGLALVKACVLPEVYVNGESVLLKAQQNADRILNYARSHAAGFFHGWGFKNPNGNHVEDRTQVGLFSAPMAKAGRWISGYQVDYTNHSSDNWAPVWNAMTDAYANSPIAEQPEVCTIQGVPIALTVASPLSHIIFPGGMIPGVPVPLQHILDIAMIMSMADQVDGLDSPNELLNYCWAPVNSTTLFQMFSAAAISNDWNYDKLRNERAREWGMEIFPLITDVLYNVSETDADTKAQCLAMINSAPCDKFCSCTNYTVPDDPCNFDNTPHPGLCTDPAPFSCETPQSGWRASNRYVHRDNQETLESKGVEYPGLDFLLLYNLYHMKYPDELPVGGYFNNYNQPRWEGQSYPEIVTSPPNLGDCKFCSQQPGVFGSQGEINTSAHIGHFEGEVFLGTEYDPISGGPIPITEEVSYSGDVTYRSGTRVSLKPGFYAEEGTRYHAYIDDFECINGQFMRLAADENEESYDNDSVLRSSSSKDLPVVFPNPNTGTFQVNYAELKRVEVYDAMGQLHNRTDAVEGGSVTMGEFESGVYLLRIYGYDDSVHQRKVVVNR